MFRRKVTLVLILLATAFILCVAGLVYPKLHQENLEGIRQMVKGIAATGALSIQADPHQTIPLDSSAFYLPAYQQLQTQLRQILGANPGLRYVWTMVPSDRPGEGIFVGDVGGSRPKPGRRYDASHIPELWKGFKEPTADLKPVKDPWGISISGYAPIRNRAGQTVAILGVDVYSQQLYRFQRRFQQFLTLGLILGIGFAIGTGGIVARWIAHPLDHLMEGMRRVQAGAFNQEISLKTEDEFQEAAAAFNRMTDALHQAREQLRGSFLKAVQSLMSALEAKDPYTRGHSEAVTRYAVEIARVLGRTTGQIETLNRLAALHDIGKIGIQDSILQKPSCFSKEEWELMHHHPKIGGKILAPLELTSEELALILNHHEREDGAGYPEGLDRSRISDLVAILSVADAYDAMTSRRPHRPAMKPPQALTELRRHAGTQFRPEVVEALALILERRGALTT